MPNKKDAELGENNAPTSEGSMSNRAFSAWIRSEVEKRLGSTLGETSKTEMFLALQSEKGSSAIFEVGRTIRDLPLNPVLQAILSGNSPQLIFERWMRIERMSHTHNRSRCLEASNETQLRIEHYALEKREIHPLHHAFLWGLLSGLFERAMLGDFTVAPLEAHAPPFFQSGSPTAPESDALFSASAVFQWHAFTQAEANTGTIQAEGRRPHCESVSRLLRSDLAYPWKLSVVARRLAMSPRALQRGLQQEEAAFSRLLIDTRLEAAHTLLAKKQLSLTEVAFCTGFSDLAHFSRTVRERYLVAPSELRSLLEAHSVSTSS